MGPMENDSFPTLEPSDARVLKLACESTRGGGESAGLADTCVAALIELGYLEPGPRGGLVATELGFAAESFLE
jgi:hypothetical protein